MKALLRALALIESKALYPERPLPLPSSYLIDPKGRMAVIYHGPVGVRQITMDATFAAQPARNRRRHEVGGVPISGPRCQTVFP